ncbi:MAG: 16S rRNA (uracil(1498)-N(3))-methyltransferase [Bacteroides sp.]|nr:16S rRNA (uracil(1498)-N(3))-methyltransferase [Bacillota bacterium]MCM1394479.1 16S rRNA (uracil(1498)-N(3))-methyltransferase [[Eubacterium] siraeum]MCM1455721.1 16S rRNA (uracil(1498)-N(3))-methyltransferase [Bacteroides sp.]
MEIRRFFVSESDISGDIVTLRGDEFLHMTRVLRYKAGYKATVCANDGTERDCTVVVIGRDCAKLRVDAVRVADTKSAHITLYAGLLKNNKTDFVVQKAVELGVDRVIPFRSANCAETKFSRERASKIALEAAKQCGSAYLSEVGELVSIDDVIEAIKSYDGALFAYECERKQKISDNLPSGKRIALIVGPEGGFQPDEAERIVAAGAKAVTLGKRILRAETAAIILCALALDGLGELSYD